MFVRYQNPTIYPNHFYFHLFIPDGADGNTGFDLGSNIPSAPARRCYWLTGTSEEERAYDEERRAYFPANVPTLSGKGSFYVWYPGDWHLWRKSPLYDQPESFRLCVDGLSPLLSWARCGVGSAMNMGWDVDTRQYPNGPHLVTAASWIHFHTGEGPSDTVEVIFSNSEDELRQLPSPSPNPNLPVPWPIKGSEAMLGAQKLWAAKYTPRGGRS